MSNTITITGQMGREAEIRWTTSGRPVLSFPVADTPRRKREDGTWEDAGETLWVDVSIWGDEAEDLAERMAGFRGRVTVTGRLGIRSYEAQGQERQRVTLAADSVALHARKSREVPGRSADSMRVTSNGFAQDPWATDGAPF